MKNATCEHCGEEIIRQSEHGLWRHRDTMSDRCELSAEPAVEAPAVTLEAVAAPDYAPQLTRIADALDVLAADKRLEARHDYASHCQHLAKWRQTKHGVDEEGDMITQYTIDCKIRQYSEKVADLEWAHPWLREGN